jgi:heme/copper-type cytochrome/quinol oxidase subunit 2
MSPTAPRAGATTTSTRQKSGLNSYVLVGIVVGIIVLVLVLILLILWRSRKATKEDGKRCARLVSSRQDAEARMLGSARNHTHQ